MASFAKVAPNGVRIIEVDQSVYSVPAILRTCYWYTDRAYILISRGSAGTYEVQFSPKGEGQPLDTIVGEFANALLDNQLRVTLAAETKSIRELIVTKAFAEGGLLETADFPTRATDPVESKQDWDTMINQAASS